MRVSAISIGGFSMIMGASHLAAAFVDRGLLLLG